MIEHRSMPIVRASRDGRTVEMRAVAYNVLDAYRTVFVPGFGRGGLERFQPSICWHHRAEEPVGVSQSHRVTPDGVYLTARLSDPNAVPRAKQAASQLADRTIRWVSIGFDSVVSRDPTAEERSRWPGVDRMIVDGEIVECSLLSVPGAVPGAEIMGVRRPFDVERAVLERQADEALQRVQGLDPSRWYR